MGSELDLDDVAAQSPLAQRQLKALRDGLALAREWLGGWGSAEPYIARIDALLEQGRSPADREAHNLEVGGSIPPPASTPQLPIAMVAVRDGQMIMGSLYTPGLPDGEHELYCEPEATAPYFRGNSTR